MFSFLCADEDCRIYEERQKELPVQVPEVDSRGQDRGITVNDGVYFHHTLAGHHQSCLD